MDEKRLDDAAKAWEARGYLVLPEFFDDAEIQAVLADYQGAWNDRRSSVTVDDMDMAMRMRMRDVSETARRTHRFKVNDLYLEQSSVRHLALNTRLVPVLQALLGKPPVLCNSLSLEYGTEQPDHVDSIYMTPRTPDDLVAVWVALEDCSPQAGLLRYWPGSHKIKPYVFSHGERHYIPEEMGAWNTYVQEQLNTLGLSAEVFPAKKGDVLLWSAHLLHGGSPIAESGHTRRSIVFHYFSEADSRAIGARLVPESGGFWIRRKQQPIPGSIHAYVREKASAARRGVRKLLASKLVARPTESATRK